MFSSLKAKGKQLLHTQLASVPGLSGVAISMIYACTPTLYVG